jgi:predicted dehydrogenase
MAAAESLYWPSRINEKDRIMIRIVIVGCGGIARSRHIPACLQEPLIELKGFYNRTTATAESLSVEYGAHCYRTVEEIWADDDVDAVIICSPTNTHAQYAIAALRAGKHVLCEKPMASTVEEAEAMIKEAKEAGKKLMIAHNQRRFLPYRQAKKLLDDGILGCPLTFRTSSGILGPGYSEDVTNWYFHQNGCGVVLDIGVHRIDLMCDFFGKPKRVVACTPTLDKRDADGRFVEADDNALALLEFESGVVGTLTVSWTTYGEFERETKIYGSNGVLTIFGPNHDLELKTRDGNQFVWDYEEGREQGTTALTDIVSLFAQCIVNDTPPLISGEDGKRAITVVHAMIASDKSGSWITL